MQYFRRYGKSAMTPTVLPQMYFIYNFLPGRPVPAVRVGLLSSFVFQYVPVNTVI